MTLKENFSSFKPKPLNQKENGPEEVQKQAQCAFFP
jgi:hypothetical protein